MWVRLKQVALVAQELEPVVQQLRDVLGLEVAYRDEGVAAFGLVNALLPIGDQLLEVVAPTRPGTAGGRQLERRGEGGYMVICHTDDHPAVRAAVERLGVRTVFAFTDDGYHCLQLHPADTGGSFLEIDHQQGGERSDGPWHPAGPTWQDARRTHVVTGIRAVELEAGDPDGVAARWAALVGSAAHAGAAGPVVPLDGSQVRLVQGPPGRPDGLAAVELATVDAPRALQAARAAGLAVDENSFVLCGTRFDLVG